MAYTNAAQKGFFAELAFERPSPTKLLPEPSDKENGPDNMVAFDLSFKHPNLKKSAQHKRVTLRPPTVATSREFALFMDAKDKEKEKVEEEKQQRRNARGLKKAEKLAEKENKKRKIKIPRPKVKAGKKK